MLKTVGIICVLLGAFSAFAVDVPLESNIRGLQASFSPDTGSISVKRQVIVAVTTPVTPTSTTTRAMDTDESTNTTTTTTTMRTTTPKPPATESLPTERIDIFMDSIRELDSNFTEVKSRKFENFPSLNLGGTTSKPTTPVNATTPNGIQVTCQTAKAMLTSISNTTSFSIRLCAILTNGSMILGSESLSMASGQLLMTLTTESWPWSDENAEAYLELNVTVSVPDSRQISVPSTMASPVTVGLGSQDSFAVLSSKVTDNEHRNPLPMPTGFPKVTPMNPRNKARITFMLTPIPNVASSKLSCSSVFEPGYKADRTQGRTVGAASGLTPMRIILFVITTSSYWIGLTISRQ